MGKNEEEKMEEKLLFLIFGKKIQTTKKTFSNHQR
jgi:hypothetical protein